MLHQRDFAGIDDRRRLGVSDCLLERQDELGEFSLSLSIHLSILPQKTASRRAFAYVLAEGGALTSLITRGYS
jgi:hypothetical protein